MCRQFAQVIHFQESVSTVGRTQAEAPGRMILQPTLPDDDEQIETMVAYIDGYADASNEINQGNFVLLATLVKDEAFS